jgi:outer membrane receptor protein involved in Fe transport
VPAGGHAPSHAGAAKTCLVVAALLALPCGAAARQATGQTDTTGVETLAELVVTAERVSTPVALTTGSVSLLDASRLRARPLATFADIVRQAPGFAFVDFDGLGFDPQAIVRGFYGGGEAEYVVLLLNGRRVHDLETGRVPWDRIPTAAIESVELVRGGASAAWGDAALGAVVNVVTKLDGAPAWRGEIAGGEHGVYRAGGAGFDAIAGRPVSVFAELTGSDGFREHAERSTGVAGATFGLIEGADRALSLFTTHDWRALEEPGPLAGAELAQERSGSAPFYRFDEADERRHGVGIEGSIGSSGSARLSGTLEGVVRRSERVRTLVLTPEFADTKHRALETERVDGSAQLELHDVLLPGENHLLLGVDAAAGRARSSYSPVFQGTPEMYATASPERGDVEQHGTGSRLALAGFFHYALQATDAVRFALGARLDGLRDSFDARTPGDEGEREASQVAFSPKVGVNVRYADADAHTGNVYASLSRSFKAPTLDQLFDQRTVPVPFPPFAVSFANDSLAPQYATSFEAGMYHRADLAPARLAAELTFSAYHIDLRDEIDFDLQTLAYRNIGRSRHRGIEAGLNVVGPATVEVFASYALQAATSRVGESDGNQLKAIPRHFLSGGIGAGGADGLAGTLVISSAHDIYLDDANTIALPDWTRWDARVAYTWRGTTVSLDAFNLLDAAFSTTGFPDPAGSALVYYHPAAGRTLQIGLSRDW